MANSNKKLKLPVGLDRDSRKLRRVDEVESGLKCNCICPGCKTPLVARKCLNRVDHFAHHKVPPDSVNHCAESALHQWAKSIVAKQALWPLLPAHYVPKEWRSFFEERLVSHDEWWSPFKDGNFNIESAEEEYAFDGWTPDVLLTGNFDGVPAQIAVEIYVSHPVDELKLAKVKRTDISLLEIDLDPDLMFGEPLTEDVLKTHILDFANQLWLHTPLADRLKEKHDAKYERDVAMPALQERIRKCEEFCQLITGRQFTVPKCGLYEFNDQLNEHAFSFLANGKSVNVASGQETVISETSFDVSRADLLADRVRLHLRVRLDKTHPLDLILRTDQSDFEAIFRPLDRTSTLLLVVQQSAPVESWLQAGKLSWLFSVRREKLIKELRKSLAKGKRQVGQQELRNRERRRETARKLANQVLDLIEQYQTSEPEWSKSYSKRFIEARRLARYLGQGPYGGHGLTDRTPNDWVFGVAGQLWKTILASEMMIRTDHEGLIKTKSLHFFLRKNRFRLHSALRSLWSIEEGQEIFDEEARARNQLVKLPTAGSALYHWLSHLAKVQPNFIVVVGRSKKGFRWIPGALERIIQEARED